MTPASTLAALTVAAVLALHAGGASAAEQTLATVVVEASAAQEIGIAESATEGAVTAKDLENRPLSRTGELLEAVPGVIVTQHSGDGKANQYFARGFNLDHGTDFRTTVLGMPVNMPTHAHGQGYTDLGFVIPELIGTIRYRKGPYYADVGDFAAVGSAAIDYVPSLDRGLLKIEAGQHGYKRTLLANSAAIGSGSLLYAIDATGQDGPWDNPERFRRFNGVLSYSVRSGMDSVRTVAMASQSSWNATDQVPLRALQAGLVGRYGAIDPSDGGNTARFSVSTQWERRYRDGALKVNAYLVQSRFELFSNFTYALDDPVNGDQFSQSERRVVAGVDTQRTWQHRLAGLDMETTIGLQTRQDKLSPVALYATVDRRRLATIREDHVTERSMGFFLTNTTQWTPRLRTIAGVRTDTYQFDVASAIPANSGRVNSSITSPKFSAVFAARPDTELYLNWGRGFHSNDARGVTGTVDPRTGAGIDSHGDPIQPATPLVKALGTELGVRHAGLIPGLDTSLSIWRLDLASELVFSGDAGTTEASRPSHRQGIEVASRYATHAGWIVDASLAWSHARFANNDSAGQYIPGALERTASIGIGGESGRWSGGLRVRYFGGRALTEDNAVRSSPSTLVNAKVGYALTRTVKLTAEVLNLLGSDASDIDYYYASRLRSEQSAVTDIHTHPAEPRSLRLGMVVRM
ncbi:TonB-dependent receptor [Noviherbaspirillum pedocola]|uniref:TonB-dependent receptor n=1 Tax=Noviherbaspirillum pedocola TaxID=2801341 RepID=UPI001F3D24AE|nr:TonB-dependent receptor [Noviherbaspirillum pedocola]